jgi:predicted metal-dependent hydrolase
MMKSLLRAPDPTRSHETRSIELAGRSLTYTLRRSRRRTLGITVDRRGLTVAIPLRVSQREAEQFLRERQQWIVDKLDEWAQRPVPPALVVVDGMQIPVLGKPCVVRLLAGANHAKWIEGVEGRELRLQLRSGADPKRALLRALQAYGLSYFSGRIEEYAWRLRQEGAVFPLPAVRLTNARTRWGSCSRVGGIRLNWRLIHLPAAQIDYVVAHEMAHLLEMNHSDRFWAVVASLCPEYIQRRAALNESSRHIPGW